jgi:uncharacterized membrane protein
MDKLKSRVQLLSLFIIFFIYKAIVGIIENDYSEFVLWFMFSIVYAISLMILYFAFKKKANIIV